jgi:hypothetical protein
LCGPVQGRCRTASLRSKLLKIPFTGCPTSGRREYTFSRRSLGLIIQP